MKKIILSILCIAPLLSNAQFNGMLNQYFDGNDTIPAQRLDVVIDQSNSAWQIGQPSKTIFNAASTLPNAILTDTLNPYPINDSSSFSFGVNKSLFQFGGIIAMNWKQKLDLEDSLDGGIVEFSRDSGNSWHNAFSGPHVYNYFGYNSSNVKVIGNNDTVFTGTDTVWRDIWLCYDASWLWFQDSTRFRYRLLSDSNQSNQEGWMIDNMSLRPTIIHTINEKERSEYIKLSPNPAEDYTVIDLKKQKGIHLIEEMRLIDMNGKEIKRWGMVPNRFKVPLENLKNGNYLLVVKTNLKQEIHQLVITD